MPAAECASDPSLTAIRHLRRVAELLAESDDTSAAWFASKLAEFEGSAKAGHRLDEILSLVSKPGCRSWHAIETQRLRDHWLRMAADRYFANRSVTAQSNQVAAALTDFSDGPDSDWKKVRMLAAPPAAWRDTERECWFQILKYNDRELPSARTIRRVLAAVKESQAVVDDS